MCPGKPLPKPRYATARTLYQPQSQPASEILDTTALVFFFPAPHSVTGEDVLEFHIHGGPAIVKSCLAAIPFAASAQNGARAGSSIIRYAEPGEFTRRAFYNSRLDLTQIEALGDALAAETEQQRLVAVKGSSNALARRYESWRQRLLYARGELEALIDFSEDQHFDDSPVELVESVKKQVLDLQSRLRTSIENASRGEILRNGINIALLGAPNAGKSSLLNRIVGREAAIVSKEEGTTRDVIDIGVDIEGFFCRFGDLAGLRASSVSGNSPLGDVEKEGMRRAKERALIADVIIVMLSVEPQNGSMDFDNPINPEVVATLRQCDPEKQRFLYVVNKSDLIKSPEDLQSLKAQAEDEIRNSSLPSSGSPVIAISCKAEQDTASLSIESENPPPESLQSLLKTLTSTFRDMTSSSSPEYDFSLGASERQRLLLEQCLQHLQDFLAEVTPDQDSDPDADGSDDIDVVLAAESLRSAADCLAKITGKGEGGNVEEVLGVVFEK